jgi:transposase
MPKTRPAYPERFGREALELVRQGRSIPDVAGSLGVLPQSLRNWKRQDDRDRGERDDGLTSAEREELRELRKRVKRVEQERDILKRVTALFARETETRWAFTGISRRREPIAYRSSRCARFSGSRSPATGRGRGARRQIASCRMSG